MRLGIFAKTFDGTEPASVLGHAAAAGFSAVQYNMACSGLPPMPDHIEGATSRAVAEASASTGVAIVAVSGTYNMIHPDKAVRDLGEARLKVLAAACQDLGTRLVTLCTGTRDPEDQWRHHPDNATREAWRDLLSSMERAVEVADAYDVDLGIEPELANVVSSAARARRLLAEMGSPRLRIVLDPANLFERETETRQREIVAAAIDTLGDRMALAHAKDRAEDGSFATAGTGVLDYDHYARCLGLVDFDGPVVAHGLLASEAPGVAGFLRDVFGRAGLRIKP
jgi:sugar phosphate isomerase/epimerase